MVHKGIEEREFRGHLGGAVASSLVIYFVVRSVRPVSISVDQKCPVITHLIVQLIPTTTADLKKDRELRIQ